MRRMLLACLLLGLAVSGAVFSAGEGEAAASSTRGRYLAGQGIIVPPEEVRIDSYLASIDYHYLDPAGEVGLTLRSGNQQYSTSGQEGVLHIGIQGARKPYADLPPMNLAFVIDKSSSMSEDQKLDWVKQGFDIFINQVRDKDFVSLVTFDDEVGILDKYLEILGRDLSQPPEAIAEAKADLELRPQVEERPVEERLNALFQEISLDLADKEPGTIAVSGFTTRDGKTSALIALLDEMAVAAIGKVERMKPAERKQLDVILQEQELALSDLMDTSKAIQVGKFLAADYLLTGSVIEMDRTVIIFGRVINVATAEIESVAQVVVPKTTQVRALFWRLRAEVAAAAPGTCVGSHASI